MNFWKNSETGYVRVGDKPNESIEELGYIRMIKSLLEKDSGHMTRFNFSGTVSEDNEYYLNKLFELGGRLLVKYFSYNTETYYFIWDDAIVSYFCNPNVNISVNAYGTSEELISKIRQVFRDKEITPAKQGYIFAIMRSENSLQLQRIGYAGKELERGNYTAKVMQDYEYVIRDLKSSEPSGRIVILDGPAGTGKTHLVRDLLNKIPDAMFVLVPPSMISSIGGPELLPMLMDHKEQYGKMGPVIFVLEDADNCLVPRGPDNMNAISSILNLGDGIFGSLFDIRIVATSNAKKVEMDSAILRAGRLSKRIEVGRLSYDEAKVIFARLLPGHIMPIVVEEENHPMKPRAGDRKYSLAEIYLAARNEGWQP